MAIKVECYGGVGGWMLKKRFPVIASEAYIRINFLLRRVETRKYIKWFMSQKEVPQPKIINIETINRCNSTCSFCPANRDSDKRPFSKMSEQIFYKMISDLKNWKYEGYISLYVNNEPLLDNRIVDFYKYVKEQLPNCKTKIFTNGLLLTKEKFLDLVPYIDFFTINNYGETMKMHENLREIVNYVNTHSEEFVNKDIKVNIRYIKDILTNRAGQAPNKRGAVRTVKELCLYPYTDMTIFSSGVVGLCCSDAIEKTCLGSVYESSLKSIWEENSGELSYAYIREKMKNGRNHWDFCKFCDFLDNGSRAKLVTVKRENVILQRIIHKR